MLNKSRERVRMGDWILLRYAVEVEANQWELPVEAQRGLLIETRNLPRRGLKTTDRYAPAFAEDEP